MNIEETAVRCKYKSVKIGKKPFECTNCDITFLDRYALEYIWEHTPRRKDINKTSVLMCYIQISEKLY